MALLHSASRWHPINLWIHLSIFMFILMFILIFQIAFSNPITTVSHTHTLTSHSSSSSSSSNDDFRTCGALGSNRLPSWANRKLMQMHLPAFSKLYDKRLIRDNGGGMRYDHSFALWYTLRSLRPVPKVVVESGAHRGHTSWMIRQALPHTHIISISPDMPSIKVRNAKYMNGKDFIDFSKIRWNETGIDTANAVVLFDDHQSADIRIIDQGRKKGFKRFVYDDNYAYLEGDNLSMKWLCETEGQQTWPGYVKRNFGRRNETQSWEQHMRHATQLKHQVKYYVEFPPIMAARKFSSRALVEDRQVFEQLVGPISKQLLEFGVYAYICYVETF